MAESEARFTTRKVGAVTVARLVGPHIRDLPTVDELGGALMAVFEAAQPPDLLIDFSDVVFLTSSFLGRLIALAKRADQLGGRVRACGVAPRILEIFKVIHLDRMVEILPTAADVLGPEP